MESKISEIDGQSQEIKGEKVKNNFQVLGCVNRSNTMLPAERENTEENLCDHGVGKDFLDMTSKSQS